MRLEDADALVTGAGSGIGRAIALELSRRNTRLILVGRTRRKLDETQALLAHPGRARVLALDLALPGAAAELATHIERLDLLVNNAGSVLAGPIGQQDEDQWRRMFEINLIAPMKLTRELLPRLRASGQGRVVNLGSMFGDIAFPYFAAYSASKFGLRGWSEGLRRELAGQGVAVTYCAPRGTRTPAVQGFATYADAFAMRMDPPENLALQIVRAIECDARDVYPAGPERIFLLLQRLLPGLVDRGLARQVRDVRRMLSTRLAARSGAPAD